MTKTIDLGMDHTFEPTEYKGEFAGGITNHLTPEGKQCSGHISFAGRSWARSFDHKITTWELVQEDPLTVTPSLLCRACGDHGWIREGKWVPA